MKTKRILVILLIGIVISLTNISAVTQEECEVGGGTWTTPQIAIGSDEPQKPELEPYCACEVGFYWNETLKECLEDSQLRCVQTQGEWINDSCQCPEGTIRWTPGFGCDMSGPVPNLDNSGELNKKEASYPLILIIILLILFLFLIIFFLNKKRRRLKWK